MCKVLQFAQSGGDGALELVHIKRSETQTELCSAFAPAPCDVVPGYAWPSYHTHMYCRLVRFPKEEDSLPTIPHIGNPLKTV